MKKTIDAYERARRGELTVLDAFTIAGGIRKDLGIGFDVTGALTNMANTINIASNVVDVLRAHGIQNIGDAKNLLNGDIERIPAFSDLFKEISEGKKK